MCVIASSNTIPYRCETRDGRVPAAAICDSARSLVFVYVLYHNPQIPNLWHENNRIYDGVEAETRKSQARFQII